MLWPSWASARLPVARQPRTPVTEPAHRMAIVGERSTTCGATTANPGHQTCAASALLDPDARQGGVDPNAMLNGFNYRQPPRITGRSYRKEATKPSYDLLTAVRTRMYQWLGHIAWMPADHLVRRAVLALGQQAGLPYQPGSFLMDTPLPLNELVLRVSEDEHEIADRSPPYRKASERCNSNVVVVYTKKQYS